VKALRGYPTGNESLGTSATLFAWMKSKKWATSSTLPVSEREELRGLADGADAALTLVIASRSRLDVLFEDDPTRTSPLHGLCGAPLPVNSFTIQETLAFLTHRLQGNSVFSLPQNKCIPSMPKPRATPPGYKLPLLIFTGNWPIRNTLCLPSRSILVNYLLV
jgi:hypothetical protein